MAIRLGIFGGTFDPPHQAHLILADEAQYQLELERVLWVLNPDPPHKEGQEISNWQIRLELLTAALDEEGSFEISMVEIERPPPHFAFETMHLLRESNPEAELIYLMGGDSLRDLPTWKRPMDFLSACDGLGVMRRPGDAVNLSDLEHELPGVSEKVIFVASPLLQISAREIRRRVASGEPVRYYLPHKVYQIILDQGLYLSSN